MLCSFLLLLCGCTGRNDVKKSITPEKVTCEKAYELEADGGLIVDVRENDEYEENHLERAVNIPHTDIVDDIGDYVDDKDSVIIVYCKSGKRSSMAASSLIDAGYTNVYDLGSINNCS